MITITSVITFVLECTLYASLFEWGLHRWFMHKPFPGFDYPFRTHALTHHRIFKADPTYHLARDEDKQTIPMAWWNGPVLITVGAFPFLVISITAGAWWTFITSTVIFSLYYGAYEYLHWCMHLPLPRRRLIERNRLFFRLNGHHLLHHRYMHRNFNVVLPLADLLFGTLLLRSPVRFAQARGVSVPDVQPRTP